MRTLGASTFGEGHMLDSRNVSVLGDGIVSRTREEKFNYKPTQKNHFVLIEEEPDLNGSKREGYGGLSHTGLSPGPGRWSFSLLPHANLPTPLHHRRAAAARRRCCQPPPAAAVTLLI